MKHRITDYSTIIFDCDGVILNSNKVKTEAFYHTALPYGEEAAMKLVEYHVANGGVSRYKKFSYFLENIVSVQQRGPNLDKLLSSYAGKVRKGLLSCEVAKDLNKLREFTSEACWLIVSGGDQSELREIFAKRGLVRLFDGGIFGSPDTKDEILAQKIMDGVVQDPALFLGDSRYDYEAATTAGLDFVFISNWSEMKGWPYFVSSLLIDQRAELRDLFNECY
ncbi:HAD hydrolase-like protein [uncultured Marinobacter sp.]|uniref:HAD family hydrolase n=1 Tax=uncultured Marinobacter sp. TaxID=187379 RepID=UPI002635CF62|nr:HAD hydrolase-like protein [uncultured Marinobacter sp.]